MKLKKIYDYINELSPFELQEKWDNSGLIVGSYDDDIKNVYISMDLDSALIDCVEENSLVITHHPLIFTGIKRVNYDTYATRLLRKLIKKNIALISMHTNIDKTHLNKYFIESILNFKIINTSGFVSYCEVNMNFNDLAQYVNKKLNLRVLKAVKAKEFIKSIAVVTGSGMSLIDEINADCFLTGDIKYHDAMQAKERGVSLIDIRHYESENCFGAMLECLLRDYLKKNKIKGIIKVSQNPFEFFIEGEIIE